MKTLVSSVRYYPLLVSMLTMACSDPGTDQTQPTPAVTASVGPQAATCEDLCQRSIGCPNDEAARPACVNECADYRLACPLQLQSFSECLVALPDDQFECGSDGETTQLAAACSNQTTALNACLKVFGGAPAVSSGNVSGCMLVNTPSNPSVHLIGTVCGQGVELTSNAGPRIQLGRSRSGGGVSSFQVKDDPSDAAVFIPEYFQNFAFLLSASTLTGPLLEVQSSTHELESGLFAACGFGMIAFKAGPIGIAIELLDSAANEGTIRLVLSDVPVAGFTEEYGVSGAPACDGTVTITLEGAFTYSPN